MLKNYLEFIEYLMGSLNDYFAAQTPYIMCEKGCAKCCTNGDYPFSEIEVKLLKQGFLALDKNTQQIILNNIDEIKKAKKLHTDVTKAFTYKCPFLINNVCSVYECRGIICRTFGLIALKEGSKMQIPFCAYEGLNYSNILDPEKNMLMADKMKELGIDVLPKAYHIHYSFLTSERIEHAFTFKFGEKASLIDLLAKEDVFKLSK